MGTLWNREPVLFLGVVQAGLALVVSFGLQLTAEQIGAVLAFSAAVLALITRTQVTPNKNPDGSIKLPAVILPVILAAGLLAPACATAPNATPAQRFFINAADANHALAANSKTLTTRLKEANSTDCDLQTEGMQPCLSDDSWAHWKSGLNVAATYGEALTKAISVADIVAARARVAAIIGVLTDLINNGTVRLREDERLIAVSLLTAAKTAFAVLANDGGVQ